MRKTIFILGCGVMQMPALRIGRELGWTVVAADGNPGAPGRELCAEFHHVDLKDVEGLTKAAKTINNGKGPDGVFTAGTDFSLSVAEVAEALGLPGHSVDAARKATDKVLMRESFRNAGIPSPRFLELKGEAEISRVLDEIPGPWVVKPVDSMGARGVVRVESRSELVKAIAAAQSYSRSGRALAESFMDGPEYSLDALVEDGRLIRCGLADRIIVYPPYFIEIGHSIPSVVDSRIADDLWAVFERGVKALGLKRGAAKGDVKLTPEGPMIGEIAGRLSGGYMSGWTWPAASGVEPTLGAMRLAVGLDAGDLDPKTNLYCAERALIGIDGRVGQLSGAHSAKSLPGIKEVFLRYATGDVVGFPRNNVEKIGNVIAVGSTPAEAEERALAALRRISLHLDPADPATGEYLDADTDFPPDTFDVGPYFAELWRSYPPKPSRGSRKKRPKVYLPMELPTGRDSNGRMAEDILRLLVDEGKIELTDTEQSGISEQDSSDFWKALIRGGLPGLRWFLETAP